jgi:toxin ParE1/3/4
MRVLWLMHARLDLIEIGEYLQSENPDAASRIMRRIQSTSRALGQFPYAGRKGRVEGTRELVVVVTPYLVPHRVTGQTVEILRVFHGAMRWPDRF